MSDAKIDDTERQSLLQSKVDSLIATAGAEEKQTGSFFNPNGGAGELAGITADFAKNSKDAVDSYISNVQSAVDQLSNPEINQAFKGTSLEQALTNFVNAVKSVANDFCKRLNEAENQILSSVETAYKEQDSDLNTNLTSDSDNISSSVTGNK